MLRWVTRAAVIALIAMQACSEDSPAGPEEPGPGTTIDTLPTPLAGGDLTVFDSSNMAFSLPAPNLSASRGALHSRGALGFNTGFIASPADVAFGLGPLFNEPACTRCHEALSRRPAVRLLRFSVSGTDAHGAPNPLPGFGTQLQDDAIPGFQPEGELDVTWVGVPGSYPDGTPYELRRPVFVVTRAYIPFDPPMTTLRAPRPVFGLGLLEAVPDATLEALADPSDTDGDGVSGRLNRVWDVGAESVAIGRFGWKASQPTVLQQNNAAYVADMGVTSSLFPTEATAGQVGGEDGLDDDPELPDEQGDAVAFFVRTLAVPGRRGVNDPEVRRGQTLFDSIGCGSCHLADLESGTLDGVPEVSNQSFHPYTDLLLHDMGEGLEDGRPDFLATGREWRTAPLWGLGLSEVVLSGTTYLHDGRAETVEEAVLWHGGEAQGAADRFMNLAAQARAAVLAFLLSL